MKEAFIRKRFNTKSRSLLSKIAEIVESYAADGYDLSLRQLYYLLAGAGHLKKSGEEGKKAYKNLGNLVSDARLAGLIDWDMIRDRGRVPSIPGRSEDIPKIVEGMKWHFKVDMWANQNCYVECFVEKQSLDNVLEPLCWQLDIPFSSNKGYSSSSAYYDASKRFLRAANMGKELHLIYLGDHDPSGVDMTRDTDDRFTLFVESTQTGEIFQDAQTTAQIVAHVDPRPIQIHRVALNMQQVRDMRLIPGFGNDKDSRMGDYYRQFGTKNIWELAAVEPRTMVGIVRDAVEALIDPETWDEDKAREDKGRADLQAFADSYGQELTPAEAKPPEIIYLPKIKKVKKTKAKKEKRPDYEI